MRVFTVPLTQYWLHNYFGANNSDDGYVEMLWNTYSQSYLLMILNFLTTGQVQTVPYTYTKNDMKWFHSLICFDCNFSFFKNDEKKNFLICHCTELQWRIQGRGLGGPPPLFLDQTVARWGKKVFGRRALLPYLRVWMTAPPSLIWRSGSATVLYHHKS